MSSTILRTAHCALKDVRAIYAHKDTPPAVKAACASAIPNLERLVSLCKVKPS